MLDIFIGNIVCEDVFKQTLEGMRSSLTASDINNKYVNDKMIFLANA